MTTAYVAGVLARSPLALVTIGVLAVFAFSNGFGAPFTLPRSFSQSWKLISKLYTIIISVWPLLLVWFAICFIPGERSFHQRVIQFAYGLISTMVIGLAASLLAADNPL
jgi:hypothetical protein